MPPISVALEAPNSPRGTFAPHKFSVERDFKVVMSSFADGPVQACNAPGIPTWGQRYSTGNETFPFANAKQFKADRIEPNSVCWLVTVTYETPDNKKNSQDSKDQHDDPRLDVATVTTTWERYTVAAVDNNDETQAPITNSAGEPFVPAPSMDKAMLVLTIKRNEDISAPHPQLDALYRNHVNDDDNFWGYGAGQVKCQAITAELKQRNLQTGQTITYLEVSYVFHCKDTDDSWDLVLLDTGTYYEEGGQILEFITTDGHPYLGLLNGAGQATDTPTYLDPIQIYPRATFATLNLPNSFLDVIPVPSG